jgi:signal-transduction protein with cAMP-binding, CBS, and nucleotidyltransferase domain
MNPNELIHDRRKIDDPLHNYFVRGRELSNTDPNYLPYFFRIPEDALDGLLKKIKIVRFLDGGRIENKNKKSNDLYIIFSGMVHIKTEEKDRTYLVGETFPNHAEFALVPEEIARISVVSFEKTVFSILAKSEFINWLLNCSDFSFGFLAAANSNREIN